MRNAMVYTAYRLEVLERSQRLSSPLKLLFARRLHMGTGALLCRGNIYHFYNAASTLS